ncbi:hypothetical protein J437_LFUL000686 [Ladona fulva]|uniref:Vitellogenin n=1 Tax=Ladona fulva TaxID=123851 RepID=A0A8K0NZA4_LADFU|nr:hypothetical protein J437_LFUL000686 [Ladona fulva]
MSAMEYQYLAIGLLALLGCINAASYLGSGFETVYDYFGDVRAGSYLPEQYASQFGIKGKLKIQYIDNEHAVFKFDDVSYQVATGKMAEQDTPKAKFIPAEEEINSLLAPFQVNYDNGKVKSVLTVDEPEWSENIKKAVAAIFQLDIQNLHWNKPNSFVTKESTIFGECPVGYTVQPKGAGWVDVIKTQKHEKCENMPHRFFINAVYEECPLDHKEDHLLPGTTRYYKLLTGKGKIEVKEIYSQSLSAAIPFNGHSDDQTILVRQNFTLVSLGKIKEKLEFTPKHERELKYTIPEYYSEKGTIKDLTGGRHVESESEIMEMTHKVLGDFVDFLETIKVSKEPEKLNTELYEVLMYYLGKSDKECLMHCFEKYMEPKTYREENMRGAFLEFAAQVGTKASISFIHDVIVQKKIPTQLAIDILRMLPQFIRDPSVAILHDFETLLDADLSEDVKKTAVLSVSNIVFYTYKHLKDVEMVNTYADKFYLLFKEESRYLWKLVYLNALVNLEEGKVFDYLVEIVHDKNYSNNLRFVAIWGTKTVAMKDSAKSYELYWPIFSNQEEKADMRAAALNLFITTESSFDRFLSLFWYMKGETCSQLYYYYYTGLESLSDTHHPCYMTIGHHAKRLLRYAKKPTTSYLFTGLYMMDYMDKKHSLGGNSVLSLIGDSYTGAPDTIYYSQGGYYMGYTQNYFGVLVKISGLGSMFKKMLKSKTMDMPKIQELEKILSQLDLKKISLKDLHMEVVFYSSEHAVETQVYDEHNYMDLVHDVEGFFKKGQGEYKYRQHHFIFSGVIEYAQPTDIGMLATWELVMPHSYQINADVSYGHTGPRSTFKNGIEIKYGRFGGTSLNFYNPLAGMWQGTYREHTMIYNIPIYNHLSIDAQQRHMKFAITRDPEEDFNLGLVYHVESQVYATDYSKDAALHASCPECLPHVVIHVPGENKRDYTIFDYDSPEFGSEYKLEIFDCDQPHTPYDLANELYEVFDDHELNYGHYPFGHFVLGFRKLHAMLGFQPAAGSCGIAFTSKPSVKYPYTQLEGVIQSIAEKVQDNNVKTLFDGGKYTVRGSITLKGDDADHIYHTLDFNTVLEQTHDAIENHLSIKVTHTSPKEKEFKLCMDAETKYPEIPADIYIVRKEKEEDVTGKVSVIWGESTDGKCPTDGSGFKVTMTAGVVHEKYDEMYPYNQCHHDAEDKEWKGEHSTPVTIACVAAAMDATTLRKFSGYVKYFNIPEKYINHANKFVDFMRAAGEFHLISYKEGEKTVDDHKPTFVVPHHVKGKDGEMKYVVEFEKNEPYVEFDLSWEGDEHEHDYHLKYDTFGFKPHFFSSRFFVLKNIAYETGFYGSCVITPSSVLTLDNDTYHYQSSHCWTLVAADCAEFPKFAIFTKKVDGPHDLAVKIYSGGNIMEIIPNKDGEYDVSVNHEQVAGGLVHGYHYPEQKPFHFKITRKDKFVNIDSFFSYVEVDYTGHSVVVSVPGMYRGMSCGLCGDFNNEDVYFERMGDVSQTCHKSHHDALDGDYLGLLSEMSTVLRSLKK